MLQVRAGLVEPNLRRRGGQVECVVGGFLQRLLLLLSVGHDLSGETVEVCENGFDEVNYKC